MEAAAPGLRAMPSAAAATALAWASPHIPEAIAMEKPALMATQCPLAVGLLGVWPNNIGLASSSSATSNIIFFDIIDSPKKSPPGGGPRHPRAAGLTLKGRHNAGISVRAKPLRPHTSW